jgi:hypothetical protein
MECELMGYRSSIIKSIQRGTITITGATSNTATITAVDITNSELHFVGHTYTANAGLGTQTYVRLDLTNSTTITALVAASPGADTLVVGFEVWEFYPRILKSVQRGTITSPATTATISAVVMAKTSVGYLGVQAFGFGAATGAGDQRAVLTNTTTVTTPAVLTATQVVGFEVREYN